MTDYSPKSRFQVFVCRLILVGVAVFLLNTEHVAGYIIGGLILTIMAVPTTDEFRSV